VNEAAFHIDGGDLLSQDAIRSIVREGGVALLTSFPKELSEVG